MVHVLSRSAAVTFLTTISIFGHGASAQALPTTEDFQNRMQFCAAGANINISGELLGSITSIYSGERTAGAISFQSVGSFLDKIPPNDRLAAYKVYTECITRILGVSAGARPDLSSLPEIQPRASPELDPHLTLHNVGGALFNLSFNYLPAFSLSLTDCHGGSSISSRDYQIEATRDNDFITNTTNQPRDLLMDLSFDIKTAVFGLHILTRRLFLRDVCLSAIKFDTVMSLKYEDVFGSEHRRYLRVTNSYSFNQTEDLNDHPQYFDENIGFSSYGYNWTASMKWSWCSPDDFAAFQRKRQELTKPTLLGYIDSDVSKAYQIAAMVVAVKLSDREDMINPDAEPIFPKFRKDGLGVIFPILGGFKVGDVASCVGNVTGAPLSVFEYRDLGWNRIRIGVNKRFTMNGKFSPDELVMLVNDPTGRWSCDEEIVPHIEFEGHPSSGDYVIWLGFKSNRDGLEHILLEIERD